MADVDKNILITPNRGQSSQPNIVFTGSNNTPLTLRVLDDGTLSFEGSAGQLFSISDGLTGTLFSISDINGLPLMEIIDDGNINIGGYSGRVNVSSLGVGTVASGATGEIRASGEITAFFSDERLKESIERLENPLEKLESLRGVTYYISPSAYEIVGTSAPNRHVGVIAQEVSSVLPEAVKPAPFDLGENGESLSGENYLTVQYEKLVPLLIEAVKELSQKVKNLEAEVDANQI